MANAYGIDSSVLAGPTGDDLDATFAERSGVENLIEDMYKLCTTPSAQVVEVDGQIRPSLFWERPPVSFDLRDYVLSTPSGAELSTIGARIETAYEDDPRFSSLSAEASYSASAGALSVAVQAVAASGEGFALVLTADSNTVTVERLQ